MYTIQRYNSSYFELWNDFTEKSKNGTFLLHRDFMEYHSERFSDHSLLIFEGEKLKALLPANESGIALHSHQGLTYGGLLLDLKIHLADVIAIVKAVLHYCHEAGFQKLFIKTIPVIYHKVPAQEMEYALFLADAKITRRDSLSVIENAFAAGISTSRKNGIKRGKDNGLTIVEDDNFELFWNAILLPNLQAKHGAAPVHSLQEIQLLKRRFPKNIRQFNVYNNGKIVAGTTIFETDTVAHAQYISGDENRTALGSIDYLYGHLVKEVFADKKYFDFGTSNENQGMKLNNGLCFWKESYGARTIIQDFYEIDTANHILLDNVII